jgi:O-methyltransferase involved in polyketide biosynthesis
VVILGAGFDSRAYRLTDLLKGAKIFEVDRPQTQEVKKITAKAGHENTKSRRTGRKANTETRRHGAEVASSAPLRGAQSSKRRSNVKP